MPKSTRLVCPAGHQEVWVTGDGKDYEGVCDVCGRRMKINAENLPDLSYTHQLSQRQVQDDRRQLAEQGPPPPKAA